MGRSTSAGKSGASASAIVDKAAEDLSMTVAPAKATKSQRMEANAFLSSTMEVIKDVSNATMSRSSSVSAKMAATGGAKGKGSVDKEASKAVTGKAKAAVTKAAAAAPVSVSAAGAEEVMLLEQNVTGNPDITVGSSVSLAASTDSTSVSSRSAVEADSAAAVAGGAGSSGPMKPPKATPAIISSLMGQATRIINDETLPSKHNNDYKLLLRKKQVRRKGWMGGWRGQLTEEAWPHGHSSQLSVSRCQESCPGQGRVETAQ